MCWTPQIPLEGSEDQGGNCFGMVRMKGHLPSRASAVTVLAAERRVANDFAERKLGITTKPSRERLWWKSDTGAIHGILFARSGRGFSVVFGSCKLSRKISSSFVFTRSPSHVK